MTFPQAMRSWLGLGWGPFCFAGFRRSRRSRSVPRRHRVAHHQREVTRVEVGPTSTPTQYEFRTPYLALNQDNHELWDRGSTADRRLLLERVVVGNLLSLSKAIGLHVEERLHAEIDLEPDGWHEIKPGVRLLGFRGTIRVNYLIPDLWGIGKSSARGFGTLTMRGE